MRRFVSLLLSLAMIAGLIIALLPLGQSFYGQWNQRALSAQWQTQKRAGKPVPAARSATSVEKATSNRFVAKHDSDSPAPAVNVDSKHQNPPWLLTKLSIPAIDLETFVVQGMDNAALRRGPGHDPYSALPGHGNCVIAGHRNVYGSYFYRLDELLPGATIILENRDGKFTYTLETLITTPDSDLTILQPPPRGAPPRLTLITCTMPYSNSRIVAQATRN